MLGPVDTHYSKERRTKSWTCLSSYKLLQDPSLHFSKYEMMSGSLCWMVGLLLLLLPLHSTALEARLGPSFLVH